MTAAPTDVLVFSPGFPAEMPFFTRGLSVVGGRVYGLGEQPPATLPEVARRHLSGYLEVRSLWDEAEVLAAVAALHARVGLDRVECLWEPGMIAAARLRERLGIPGMSEAETLPFRDKERMKQVLDRAGIRTPRHFRARTAAEVREAAAGVGFPLVVKPIAGAGSADTYRSDGPEELEAVLRRLGHVPEVSVEEFVAGEEYTFDTISVHGEIAYFNIAWYRPKPMIGRSVEWISPQTVTLRDVDDPRLAPGRAMGRAVLRALGFRTGFTHMEWFLTPEGEAVFGEIAARPPGARSVELMNYACDIDVFTGWAEGVCRGTFTQPVERLYNAAVIFKRAQGEGRIQRVEGLESLLARFGRHIVVVDLLRLGEPRRNWRQTLLSDGSIIVRHPDLAATLAMADEVGVRLQLYAG
jgi:hypothetical protein